MEDFYDRVLADRMIGFLFVGADRDRLVQKEWELTAGMLGGDVRYTGQPMRQAHSRSPILGGHFERRQKLLRDALEDHGVPEDVIETWLAHNEKLRPQVTSDRGSECSHEGSERRLEQEARRLPIASDAHASAPPKRGERAGAPSREKLHKLGRLPR